MAKPIFKKLKENKRKLGFGQRLITFVNSDAVQHWVKLDDNDGVALKCISHEIAAQVVLRQSQWTKDTGFIPQPWTITFQ